MKQPEARSAQAQQTEKQKAAEAAARAEQKIAQDHALGKASEKDLDNAREKADKADRAAKAEKNALNRRRVRNSTGGSVEVLMLTISRSAAEPCQVSSTTQHHPPRVKRTTRV